MEAAFSLGVYSRRVTGRGGRLPPPPRRCPPGHGGGEGRAARAARTAGGGDGALPAAGAAAAEPPSGAGCPPPSGGGGSSSPSAPPAAPRTPTGHPRPSLPGGAAGLGTCSVWMPKKERRARKMQTHCWKDEGDCRFPV